MSKPTIITDFIAGGWVIGLLGGVGMIIRYTSGNMKFISWNKTFLNIFSSVLLTTMAWALLDGYEDVYSWVKAVAYGLSGLIGPEIIKGLVFLGGRFASNPMETIKEIKDSNDQI